MAVAGTWQSSALWDTGAAKWGTGVNPVHEIADQGRGREYPSKLALGETGPSDVVAPEITSEDFGYGPGDWYGGVATEGDPLRQTGHDRPWGGHRDRSSAPANYPDWGAGEDAGEFRAIPHHSLEEQLAANVVFLRGVNGGWRNKQRTAVNQPVTSDQRQYEITTSMTQGPGKQQMTNDRAVARGTDAPRSPILSRSAAMRILSIAESFGMGGGPGSPDMAPYQQSQLKRPFYYRSVGTPPGEQHFMNTMEGRQPLQYVPTADPDPGAEVGTDTSSADNYGYESGDYYG